MSALLGRTERTEAHIFVLNSLIKGLEIMTWKTVLSKGISGSCECALVCCLKVHNFRGAWIESV